MLNDGYSSVEIAKVLILDEKTIWIWKNAYKARKNLANFLMNDCRGYSGKLKKEEQRI
ncbi:MAG: hypothetical protein HRT90_08190, partial [Candidatus Margulisbacteria bacterium]|nr:hypothetical protein [Candidatus Margulisiibacteriota bacterium]